MNKKQIFFRFLALAPVSPLLIIVIPIIAVVLYFYYNIKLSRYVSFSSVIHEGFAQIFIKSEYEACPELD